MTPEGSNEKILTNGWQDEAPSWAPSGQTLLFQRTDQAGHSKLLSVAADGGEAVSLPTPQDGSDPNWSPVRS
jgi:TolB protein